MYTKKQTIIVFILQCYWAYKSPPYPSTSDSPGMTPKIIPYGENQPFLISSEGLPFKHSPSPTHLPIPLMPTDIFLRNKVLCIYAEPIFILAQHIYFHDRRSFFCFLWNTKDELEIVAVFLAYDKTASSLYISIFPSHFGHPNRLD